MPLPEENLPSNRKFGLFFSVIFLISALYFVYSSIRLYALIFGAFVVTTLFITLFFPQLLLPFNKLWMKLGLLIGKIVSPVVMGLIYFLIFTPIALVFKLTKRDYLNMKQSPKNSFWQERSVKAINPESFKNQF